MKMKGKAYEFVWEVYGCLEKDGWPDWVGLEEVVVEPGLKVQIEKHFENLKHPKEVLTKLEKFFQNNKDTK